MTFGKFSFLLILILSLALILGLQLSDQKPEVRDLRFSFEKGGKTARLLIFSDLHLRPEDRRQRRNLHELVSLINSLEPDYVLFLGDIVDFDPSPLREKEVIAAFRRIRTKVKGGKLAVLGNHDFLHLAGESSITKADERLKEIRSSAIEYGKLLPQYTEYFTPTEVEEFFQRAGFNLIRNSHRDFGDLRIIGVDSQLFGLPMSAADLEGKVEEETFNLVLFHENGYTGVVREAGAQLGFSGHSHGGQITLFGKPLKLPELGEEYLGLQEVVESKTGELRFAHYNTTGLGTTGIYFRLWKPAEIALVTIEY